MKEAKVNEPFTGGKKGARESHGIRNVQSIKACNRRATNCVTINNTSNNRSQWKNYRREISLRCFLFTLRNLCLLFTFDIFDSDGNIFHGNVYNFIFLKKNHSISSVHFLFFLNNKSHVNTLSLICFPTNRNVAKKKLSSHVLTNGTARHQKQ